MKEKTGIVLYYTYEDEEFKDLTLEEIGALCLGCLAADRNKKIRSDAQKVIEGDRTVKTVFREMKSKTNRATEKWYDVQRGFQTSKEIKEIMQELDCDYEKAKEILKERKNTPPPQQTKIEEEIEDLFIQYDLHKEAEEDMFTESVSLLFLRENANNLPNEENWENLKTQFTNEKLRRSVELGNKDKWEKPYDYYQEEIENEEEYPI